MDPVKKSRSGKKGSFEILAKSGFTTTQSTIRAGGDLAVLASLPL